MLVLSRRESEGLWIDGRIYVKVLDVNRGRAKLGIEAPEEVPIIRDELAAHPSSQAGPTAPSAKTCDEGGRKAIQDAHAALQKAGVALTAAGPYFPVESNAGLAVSSAISSIDQILHPAHA